MSASAVTGWPASMASAASTCRCCGGPDVEHSLPIVDFHRAQQPKLHPTSDEVTLSDLVCAAGYPNRPSTVSNEFRSPRSGDYLPTTFRLTPRRHAP
jgi:hypothetical protein